MSSGSFKNVIDKLFFYKLYNNGFGIKYLCHKTTNQPQD